ncbi:hypothetical protein D3C78_1943700 [compost metagenome]
MAEANAKIQAEKERRENEKKPGQRGGGALFGAPPARQQPQTQPARKRSTEDDEP